MWECSSSGCVGRKGGGKGGERDGVGSGSDGGKV
jgi:hypothetical protein